MDVILDSIRSDYIDFLDFEDIPSYKNYHKIRGYDIDIHYNKKDDEIVIDVPLSQYPEIVPYVLNLGEKYIQLIEVLYLNKIYKNRDIYFKINPYGISTEYLNIEDPDSLAYLRQFSDDQFFTTYLPLRNIIYHHFFELLPTEMNTIIISYLNYATIVNFNEAFENTIDWKYAMIEEYGRKGTMKAYLHNLIKEDGGLMDKHFLLHIQWDTHLFSNLQFQIPRYSSYTGKLGYKSYDLGYQMDIDLLKFYDIISITIYGIHIRKIPKEIKFLRNLRDLSMKLCQLQYVPFEILDLKELWYVDLSNNKIKDYPDFRSNPNIEHLYLDGNYPY